MRHAFRREYAGRNLAFARKDAGTRAPYLGLALAFGLCLGVFAVLATANQADSAPRKLPLGFRVNCETLPSREVDPIVYPGKTGVSHLHDPFGQGLDPDMTHRKLRNDPSNCRFKNGSRVDDRSAYWIPSFYAESGRKVPVRLANFYYRVKPGIDPNNIEPYPRGLKIVAGKADAMGPQMQPDGFKPGKPIVEWKCFTPGNFSNEGHLPTDCGRDQRVAVSVTFPDCAKPGVTDSADHRSHMAYSSFNRCPSSHPKRVMQLNLFVVYDLHNGKGAYLSSSHKEPGEPKSAYGMHADFFEAWGDAQIKKLISNCVYSGNGCRQAGTSGR